MLRLTAMLVSVFGFGAALAAPEEAGSTPAPAPAPAPAGGAAPAKDPEADRALDEFLARLERANAQLRTVTANVRYLKVFSEIEGGDKHIREGTLYFAHALDRELAPALEAPPAGAPPRRGFAVHLKTLLIDGGGPATIQRDEPRRWVFDGSWLVEFKDAERQFTKQRVVAAGDQRDPMRIGEGPLPIPIGQRPADMRAAFDLALLSADAELPEGTPASLLKRLQGAVQLRLVPQEGTRQAADFREIRIWYRAEDLLPVFARTSNTSGTRDEILLWDLRLNETVPAGTFDTTTPDAKDGWQGQVRDAAPARVARPLNPPPPPPLPDPQPPR